MSGSSFIRLTGALCLSASFLTFIPVHAAETREWTDTKGRTITAAYERQDDSTVWVRRNDGKELVIPKNTLSDADKLFLSSVPATVEVEPVSGGTPAKANPSPSKPAPAPAPAGGSSGNSGGGAIFSTVKIDPASIKPVAGGFKLDSIVFANAVESDHFVIAATEKVKPAVAIAFADAAERLRADLFKDLPSLEKGFGGRKFLIVLAANEGEAKILDSWHEKHAEASKGWVYHSDLTEGNILQFPLEEHFAEELHVCQKARVYRTDAKFAQNLKPLYPQRIHFCTSDFFFQGLGNVRQYEKETLDAFSLVFAYEREFSICGKIETEVKVGYGETEVESFKNGKGWAAATRKLISKGVKPDIEGFLTMQAAKAAPKDLGMGFGLVQWIRRDPKLLAGLDRVIDHARTAKKYPKPEDFAAELGFDSLDALNAAWLKYMESSAFQ